MKQKIYLKIFIGITTFVIIVIILTKVFVEPWIGKKIISSLHAKSSDYQLKIEKVHVSILSSAIELNNINLVLKPEQEGQSDLTGEIESAKFKGIHLLKALFKKEIDIREVDISNSRLTGKFAFPKEAKPVKVSPLNIRIGNLFFDKLFVDIKSTTTAQTFFIRDGIIKGYDINVEKNDSIMPDIIDKFDFNALELKTVTTDSLYTISVVGINYSDTAATLTASRFICQPNYTEYGFTSRNQFQTDRFDANLSGITFHNFSVADYIKSGNITSSYIEIVEMGVNVFRDKRKEFKHLNRPTFQDQIYNYPSTLNIDSIGIISGNIVYSEHAEKANEKGSIIFAKLNATISKITNDTIYKTEKAYLKLNANALLMGKSKISVLLESRVFDSHNTFTVNGTLSEMEVSEMNPYLEKNAFIHISSGKINSMNFSFLANNTNAVGKLKLLYQGLDITVISNQPGDAITNKKQIKTMIANIIVIKSNPMPGKDIRQGIIEYERDPERFLFNYCAKTITSGIKSSLIGNSDKKKKSSERKEES